MEIKERDGLAMTWKNIIQFRRKTTQQKHDIDHVFVIL